jgi:outer membrane receptor for ferrienterochelin and colicins
MESRMQHSQGHAIKLQNYKGSPASSTWRMTRQITLFFLLSWGLLSSTARLHASEPSPTASDILDMKLEDLMNIEIDTVYGSSGYKQDVNSAPGSITIITADEIKRYGYRTLADMMRNVPGFYITSDLSYNYVGMRGFATPGDYNSRILLMVDGHWANDPVTAGVPYGMEFPVDIELIDRVEVIRGPNSSVYVASGLLGVINVVTKRVQGLKGVTVSGEVAGYGAYRGRVTYGHQFANGLSILFSGSYFNSAGPDQLYFKEFDTPFTNHGIARNADGAQAYQTFVKLSYRNFTLEGFYGSSEQADPTAPLGTIFNDNAQRFRVMPGGLDLKYERKFGSDWGYVARFYYDNDRSHGTYPFNYTLLGGAPRVLREDWRSGQDAGVSVAVSKTLPWRQTLVFGGEYRDYFQQNQWNYNAQPYFRYFTLQNSSSILGGHVQDEIRLRPSLILDLGLSYDRYSTFGGTTNPRAALIYQPTEKTDFKLLYGQSFRAPTAFELYANSGVIQANPLLKPETARTMELVFEQALPQGFQIVASGYYYPIRDLISAGFNPAVGALMYNNKGRVDLTGTELTIKRQSKYGLEVGGSLSLQNARAVDNQTVIMDSPRVLSQASFSIPLFQSRLFASMNLQYVSRSRTFTGRYADAYVLPNFTLFNRNTFRGWELSASVYNFTDEQYVNPASFIHAQDLISQRGRDFRLKFTYHF